MTTPEALARLAKILRLREQSSWSYKETTRDLARIAEHLRDENAAYKQRIAELCDIDNTQTTLIVNLQEALAMFQPEKAP